MAAVVVALRAAGDAALDLCGGCNVVGRSM